jgi:hypothetical protein
VASLFRGFRETFSPPALPENLVATYTFMDEYVSLLIDWSTHHILKRLALLEPQKTQNILTDLIQEETRYRIDRGYPSIIKEDGDNETFPYRLSILKKFAGSALHLSVRTVEEGRGVEELALAIAAGIAMVFFTSVAFYTQKIYGALSITFAMALVISYMFKDRLKAAIQTYFLRWLSDKLMDQSTGIYDPLTHEKIGVCRETVDFITEPRVDPGVLKLRNRDHIADVENNWRNENVLRYVKEIALRPKLLHSQSRKTTVTGILRFNLRNFLLKMDEPLTEISYLKNGHSEVLKAARVYHVNMVIKFMSPHTLRYKRVRLVLTRQGIKRIEPVSEWVERSGEERVSPKDQPATPDEIGH